MPKASEKDGVFICDNWEYRFIDRNDASLDECLEAAKSVLDEIFARNKHPDENHPVEQLALKEALNVIPSAKKESMSSKNEKVIVLQTYLGNNSEVICPESVDGYTVVRLSSSAFSKCENILTKLTVSTSIQKIPETIFKNCSKLNTIDILGESEYYAVIDGCLYEKSSGMVIFCSREKDTVTIQGNVRQIGSNAFSNCNNLNEIIITADNITIPKNLFTECKRIRTLRLPNSFVAFDYKSGVLSKDYPATAYNVDLTRCDKLSDVFYDGTWEQWFQKPVCICGTVAIHVQDGTVHNDRRREDFFDDLMAKLGESPKPDS